MSATGFHSEARQYIGQRFRQQSGKEVAGMRARARRVQCGTKYKVRCNACVNGVRPVGCVTDHPNKAVARMRAMSRTCSPGADARVHKCTSFRSHRVEHTTNVVASIAYTSVMMLWHWASGSHLRRSCRVWRQCVRWQTRAAWC